MPGEIDADELNPETKEKLGLTGAGPPPSQRPLSARLIAFGNIITCLKGLSHKDSVWALKNALAQVELSARCEGYRDRTNGRKKKRRENQQ